MTLEELKHAIVHVAVDRAPSASGKVLVYAEVQEDEWSSALFYEQGGAMVFDEEVADLQYLVLELWERWHQTPGRQPWSVLACLVDGDRVEFDFSAPGQGAPGQARLEERLRAFRGDGGGNAFDRVALDA